jgi:uracil-DNA glycosylase family 4
MEDAVEQLDHLARTVSECTICDELVACRLRAVPGAGHPHCAVMVVSLHPSVEDEQGGRAAGESVVDELAAFMPALAASRDGLYVTTVAKCVPRTECALRDTKTSECDACFRYLSRELSITTPHYILTVGEQATRYVLGKLFSTPPYAVGDSLELRLFDNPAFKVVPVATPAELRERDAKARKEYTERLHSLGQVMGLSV